MKLVPIAKMIAPIIKIISGYENSRLEWVGTDSVKRYRLASYVKTNWEISINMPPIMTDFLLPKYTSVRYPVII